LALVFGKEELMNKNSVCFIFESSSSTFLAEKVLKQHNMKCKLVQIPKELSKDCGVCVKISEDILVKTKRILSENNIQIKLESLC